MRPFYLLTSAWSFNMNTMSWREEASLPSSRSNHVCGTIKYGKTMMVVIAAGGFDLDDRTWTSQVRMLYVYEKYWFHNIWSSGPEIPITLTNPSSAVSSDRRFLFVIGGQLSAFIFKLQCLEDFCIWTKMDHETRSPNAMGVTLMLQSKPMVARVYPNSHDCTDITGNNTARSSSSK